MASLKRVNRNTGLSPAPSPAPPASGPGSGFATPASARNGGRLSPPRPASSASQYAESPFGGGMSSGSAVRSAYEVEQHNDDLLSGLLGKVDTLKKLTIGIGDEVRDGNAELGAMNDSFGTTGNLLSGTFRRMTNMARRQGMGWCWFMLFLLFVVWLFMVVWWWRR